MLTILAVIHLLLVVSFTARILLRDDLSPPARLAWFIVLNVIPYVGVTIYFFFGEIDIGQRTKTRYKLVFDDISTRAVHLMGTPGSSEDLIDSAYLPAFNYAASVNGFYPVAGNTVELMSDAMATRDHLVRDIDAAEDHVHVLYYIWLDDQTGTEIAEALIRAASRGVTCRALADGLGSRALIRSPVWHRMKSAGVRVAVTLPIDRLFRTMLTSRVDLRNHRKITVIDGRVTYCGSRNAADPEFRVKPKYAPWVDIMMRFQGPVVAQNQILFVADWKIATGENLDPIPTAVAEFENGFPAQVLGDGPTIRRGATPQFFSVLIASARRQITISTPYFVPDATLLEAICAAAFRGVRVTLIFPSRNDSWVVAAASRSFYRRLLEAGCKIYEFRDGLLHAKTLTIDETVTVVGSTNLDLRSFDLNYENNILFQDEAATKAVRARQSDYILRADCIGIEAVLAWSPVRRVWHNAVATIGPIL
ncbi:cardiolipin synthase [Roseobacter sp.]|uniref:cardiolipin synthase n=1 Tax=Roseobacter sp. TaxID=1907202 RepID=UPI00385FA769